MALGTPTDGGAAYSAGAGGTTVAPAYPASIANGDCLVLIVGQKPSTANGGTVTTPSGWTLRETLTGAGGYGTTLAADTGNTNLFFYTKDTVNGTETGNLTVTVGTNNICWGIIVRIPSGVGSFSYGTADGTRDTAPTSGTAFTTTLTNGATAPNLANGDMAIWAMCIPTDVLNNGFTAPTISSTGTTFGTAVELEEPDSNNGNDIGGYVAYAAATAGSSTAAPTVGVTATGTVTNVRGPIALIRVREVLPTITGSMSATETGSDTASFAGDVIVNGSLSATETGTDTLNGSGKVIVSGSLAATETGTDTFSASGTVTATPISGSMAATEVGTDTFSGSGKVIVSGSLSATEVGSDTFSASGTVLISGSLSATETGTDAFSGQGFLTQMGITGSMAATETGDDTLASSGKVLISGNLAANEIGLDTFSSSGNVLISGSLSATESGLDAFSGSGNILISGSLSASETGIDSFSASGNVLVSGSLAATEVGTDTFSGQGFVSAEITGSMSATEVGTDLFSGQGTTGVEIKGSMSATESMADQLGGYVFDSYVAEGYVKEGIDLILQPLSGRVRKLRRKKQAFFLQGGLSPYVVEQKLNATAKVTSLFAVSSCASIGASGTVIINGVAILSLVSATSDLGQVRGESFGNITDEEIVFLLTT